MPSMGVNAGQFLIAKGYTQVYNLDYMAEHLQELEKVRQKFVTNISHELRSPLISLVGFYNPS